MVTHSSIIAGKFHGQRSLVGYKELNMTEQLHFHFSHLWIYWGFPSGSVVKNLPASVGDIGNAGLIPGLGRSLE